MERDVVLLRILVMKERETVTDLVMEVPMMVMLGVTETLFVVPTIVNYLETIIIRRTIVARRQCGVWTWKEDKDQEVDMWTQLWHHSGLYGDTGGKLWQQLWS